MIFIILCPFIGLLLEIQLVALRGLVESAREQEDFNHSVIDEIKPYF